MAPPVRKHLRVLLPFSCDILRIPDELAAEMGAKEALVVVPLGKGKVRQVEVRRDAGGAFLGRGWPEFAAACGAGAGWFLVLRHHGGGVLTVKVFDASGCLRELGSPRPASEGKDWYFPAWKCWTFSSQFRISYPLFFHCKCRKR
ncbi:unnamed protein product [Urochloa humidicola]